MTDVRIVGFTEFPEGHRCRPIPKAVLDAVAAWNRSHCTWRAFAHRSLRGDLSVAIRDRDGAGWVGQGCSETGHDVTDKLDRIARIRSL